MTQTLGEKATDQALKMVDISDFISTDPDVLESIIGSTSINHSTEVSGMTKPDE